MSKILIKYRYLLIMLLTAIIFVLFVSADYYLGSRSSNNTSINSSDSQDPCLSDDISCPAHLEQPDNPNSVDDYSVPTDDSDFEFVNKLRNSGKRKSTVPPPPIPNEI